MRRWTLLLLAGLALCGCGEGELNVSLEPADEVLDEDSSLSLQVEQGLSADLSTPTPPYGWPLKPFDAQHPVRGFLNDPRCPQGYDGSPVSFHFGIDVAGADLTPVYAVESGTVVLEAPQVLSVVSDNGRRTFSYWHLVHQGVVTSRQHVEKGQQVGVIAKNWGHVHLAEVRGGRYLNPLRPGAITPFHDYGAPFARVLEARRGGGAQPLTALRGVVDLVVDAQDVTPVKVQEPGWANKPVTPALIRFRVLRGATVVKPWATAVDFRDAKLDNAIWRQVYAPGTDQNHPDDPGRYWFWLLKGWNTDALPNGAYQVEVSTADIRGNETTKSFALTLAP